MADQIDNTPTLAIGQVQWHGSDEDSGPDVGILIRLTADRELWLGERSEKEGGGIGFLVYSEKGILANADLGEYDEIREVLEQYVAPALASAKISQADEVERLQAALREIADSGRFANSHAAKHVRIARAALATQPATSQEGNQSETPISSIAATPTPDYNAAWKALSQPLSWMHDNPRLKQYWGWNLADIANDLIDKAYPGLRSGEIVGTTESTTVSEGFRAALVEIEKFGHGDGHGRGYTCADMAAAALARVQVPQ